MYYSYLKNKISESSICFLFKKLKIRFSSDIQRALDHAQIFSVYISKAMESTLHITIESLGHVLLSMPTNSLKNFWTRDKIKALS
jgi:hypothetical protein